ncbi:MAG TPA: AAA family ATPase [Aromatoleum sp.]|uniref:AAA family ATPase n=1 Tax=Aromatoleum sp. TaxID=2307007 RepID=UPI002B4620AB|nr:AAA family ATPase [Aromatoleum sp.]HJV26170.1 AAA family ATPase [Aromatoleum sp.]
MSSIAKLPAILAALEHGLIERGRAVRLALLAALAGEHTLLVGPPGTAKSELARRLHLAFADARYFERLLTRFSVPEELFGPLSISALEQDRYERQTAGFLPQASIAFIDEVFKANSAILNALLTLLNEREFDNGARREACPLISVIGATNEVPEDEVGEAFFDRFLVRMPVAPVSAEGFRALLGLDAQTLPPPFSPLDAADRQALDEAAQRVGVPEAVTARLLELRDYLIAEELYVSDRRWVKLVRLLRVAAASEGRAEVSRWDLWLLPWCVAPDIARQQQVADWLCARLGVREAMSPARLTRVVEAFEAQLEVEQDADDLDYDESGRLRFADEFSDGKHGEAALRMPGRCRRRYGERHIAARVRQIDELAGRLAGYAGELDALRQDLDSYAAQSLWLDQAFAEYAAGHLGGTADALAALRDRTNIARAGFLALPRLSGDPGVEPEPVAYDPLVA